MLEEPPTRLHVRWIECVLPEFLFLHFLSRIAALLTSMHACVIIFLLFFLFDLSRTSVGVSG